MSDSHEIQILFHQTTICQWSQSGRILIIHSPEVNSWNGFYPHCLGASHGSRLPTPMASGLRDFWIEALEHTRLTHRNMAGSGCSSHRWLTALVEGWAVSRLQLVITMEPGQHERRWHRSTGVNWQHWKIDVSACLVSFIPRFRTLWWLYHHSFVSLATTSHWWNPHFWMTKPHCCQSKPLFPEKKHYSLLDWWPIRGSPQVQGTISAAAKSEYFSAQWDACAGASRLVSSGCWKGGVRNRPTRGPATFWFPTVARIRQTKQKHSTPAAFSQKFSNDILVSFTTYKHEPVNPVSLFTTAAASLPSFRTWCFTTENNPQASGALWS